MTSLVSLFKDLGAPGSIPLLLIGTGLGLALWVLWPRRRAVARAWLASLFGTYFVLSLPVVANGIARRLPVVPLQPALGTRGLDALIVFDGDNRRGRVATARQVFDLTHPGIVWLLGNPWMLDALWHSGVTYDDIRLDSSTLNTLAQMAWVTRFAAAHPDARLAIIASRLQLPRVAALARRAHVDAALVASPIDVEPPTSGLRCWVPSYYALRTSRDALYEHAALRYYRWQGWIA